MFDFRASLRLNYSLLVGLLVEFGIWNLKIHLIRYFAEKDFITKDTKPIVQLDSYLELNSLFTFHKAGIDTYRRRLLFN